MGLSFISASGGGLGGVTPYTFLSCRHNFLSPGEKYSWLFVFICFYYTYWVNTHIGINLLCSAFLCFVCCSLPQMWQSACNDWTHLTSWFANSNNSKLMERCLNTWLSTLFSVCLLPDYQLPTPDEMLQLLTKITKLPLSQLFTTKDWLCELIIYVLWVKRPFLFFTVDS